VGNPRKRYGGGRPERRREAVAAAAASCVVGQDGWESLQYIHETKGGRPAWPRHPFSPAVRLSTETVQIVQILEVFKKKLLLLENQSAVPQSVPPAAPAPAPPPRLEDLPPLLRRAACRGSAPRHVLARAPAMAVVPEGEVEGAPNRPLLHRTACPRRSSRRARPTL